MYLANLSAQAVCNTRSIFKTTSSLKLEFSFSLTGCSTEVKEPSLPYCLLKDWGGEQMYTFPKVLALCEMESLSRI